MEVRELTCINCPMGCSLKVTLDGKNVVNVEGYTCLRGKEYGRNECTNPVRTVTSTVVVKGGSENEVSVKTEKAVPKDKIFECIDSLKGVEINAPVNIGDVVVKDVCGTGINIIATKKIYRA